MATQLQLRRGTTSENASFTGAVGEVTVDTTKDTLIVQDGSTAGGFELARADGSNFVATSVDINGGTIDGTTIGASSASTGAFTTLTASTGIDVTGTATMDGLTVENTSGSTTALIRAAGGGNNSATLDLTSRGSGNQYRNTEIVSVGENSPTAKLQFKLDNTLGNLSKALEIDGNGDISFYEDTGTTPKLFWDASAESLGIGTSSPDSLLTIDKDVSTAYSSTDDGAQRSDTNTLLLKNEDGTENSFAQIAFDLAGSNQSIARIVGINDGTSTSALAFVTEGSNVKREVMRLDGSGNVGIGTSSPACHLDVKGSGNGSVSDHLRITSTDTDSKLAFVTTTGSGAIVQSGYAMLFMANTANTERMRIDPSGNLLVGKTSADNTTAGCRVRGDGFASFVRSGAEPVLINRLTNDGSLLTLQKGGTTVGSIGVSSSNNLTVGSSASGHVGFELGNQYLPLNGGSASNGELDLGSSTRRFKDLYLSGGVYLGGTGAANKLDDYEEGTWTPTAQLYSGTMTVNSATYTKIGNLVTLKASVTFDATTDNSAVSIQNVPFAHTGANKANGGYVTASTVATASKISGSGSGTFNLKDASGSAVTYTAIAGSTLDFVLIYETA